MTSEITEATLDDIKIFLSICNNVSKFLNQNITILKWDANELRCLNLFQNILKFAHFKNLIENMQNLNLSQLQEMPTLIESLRTEERNLESLKNPMVNESVFNEISLENQPKIRVSCVIGSITMSLQGLLDLKIGCILEFIKKTDTVELYFDNNLFAIGYLVEINGKIGVKILKKRV